METTAIESCNILTSLLVKNGIVDVVISPGSRNAPLIIAIARNKELNKHIIVDERSAAFTALGICAAKHGKNPVVLICTSGSALLNYAPAIAEAYYRNLPLIVISADRPIEWIDQDDSQTIRQYEALSNYVKRSYDIPTNCYSENIQWYINRIINDAIITSNSDNKGPVHINVQLDEPLNDIIDIKEHKVQRYISAPLINREITHSFFDAEIYNSLKEKNILIIAGFQNCTDENWVTKKLNNKINPFETFITNHNNVVLLTESISNINCKFSFGNIDRLVSNMTENDKIMLRPDIVISFGGALVSRFIKQYLREIKPKEHWHIGLTNNTIDCFKCLTMRINMFPFDFFNQINNSNNQIIDNNNSYREKWINLSIRAESAHNTYINNCPWSDLKAFSIILPHLKGNLHLSNGTPIRYQQLFNQNNNITSVYCNRGVSGIDGCTSTAIGHAISSSEITTLISGDLSAQYDIGALSIENIPSTFKMIVICNGGGGIFRFIKSTSCLPELDKYFATKAKLPLKELALGYGFKYFQASSEIELEKNLLQFLNEKKSPSILAIITPEKTSAEILKKYFN